MGCSQGKGFLTSTPLDPDSPATLQHFEMQRVIGQGGFGKVKAVTKRREKVDMWYAMKVLNKDTIVDRRRVKEVFQERDLLTYLRDPRICNLYFSFQDAKHLYLVMDIALGGDLRYQLNHNVGGRPFTEDRVRIYVAQVALALQYVHSRGVVHRDIKPENILLKGDGMVMLTDFGISAQLDANGDCFSGSGTRGYMPPELMLASHRHGKPADWFALGVTAHELLTKRRPFRTERIARAARALAALGGSSRQQLLHQQVQQQQQEEKQQQRVQCDAGDVNSKDRVLSVRLAGSQSADPDLVISAAFESFLGILFMADPRERAGEKEVFAHPWFATSEMFSMDRVRDGTQLVPFLPDTKKMNAEPDADIQNLFMGYEEEKAIRVLSAEEQELFRGYEFDYRFAPESVVLTKRSFEEAYPKASQATSSSRLVMQVPGASASTSDSCSSLVGQQRSCSSIHTDSRSCATNTSDLSRGEAEPVSSCSEYVAPDKGHAMLPHASSGSSGTGTSRSDDAHKLLPRQQHSPTPSSPEQVQMQVQIVST
jgi:serine/threonine protein kinase